MQPGKNTLHWQESARLQSASGPYRAYNVQQNVFIRMNNPYTPYPTEGQSLPAEWSQPSTDRGEPYIGAI